MSGWPAALRKRAGSSLELKPKMGSAFLNLRAELMSAVVRWVRRACRMNLAAS